MTTTISLPDPVLENAMELAEKRGITLSDLIQEALVIQMARAESAPQEFRLYTVNGGFVNPNIDLDKTSAFIIEDDEEEYGGQI